MKKAYSTLFFLIIFSPFLLFSQQPGKLSFQVTPGINLPLGASKDMFTIGGGGEIVVQYSMPFASVLFARGSLDYSLVPTLAENSLSLISFGAGAGISYDVIPKLNLAASFSGGYGLGIYSGQTGGKCIYRRRGGYYLLFLTVFRPGSRGRVPALLLPA